MAQSSDVYRPCHLIWADERDALVQRPIRSNELFVVIRRLHGGQQLVELPHISVASMPSGGNINQKLQMLAQFDCIGNGRWIVDDAEQRVAHSDDGPRLYGEQSAAAPLPDFQQAAVTQKTYRFADCRVSETCLRAQRLQCANRFPMRVFTVANALIEQRGELLGSCSLRK